MLEYAIVDDMTEAAKARYLKRIIAKLDDLDAQDFFGTEGWRHYLGFED